MRAWMGTRMKIKIRMGMGMGTCYRARKRTRTRMTPCRGWYGKEVSKFVDLVVDAVSTHLRRPLR